ncbi:MAG: type I DNA topoisomerase [Clostridia bacterium]|nr:type I DNA topoisomerase [Clostridia bacterium]
MSKTLVIVESPTKAKAISKFLGSKYIVRSSMGHVRDLPKSELGVDVENNFEPKYITIRGKGEILKILKDDAKKASRILLAADPDREGEVIAWHLKHYLKAEDELCRIEFNEITKDTVLRAIKEPRTIDMNRVNSQQARRVLDRLVGYKISPLLWAKVKKGLSAGRVQSVAVRLICDREEEINAFVPEEYWTLDAVLLAEKGNLTARLQKINGKKVSIGSEVEMAKVKQSLTGAVYKVESITTKEKKKNPVPPFTTSSMQQEAYRKAGYTTKKTMQIAQQLYEGIELGKEGVVGLISYMRTDSTRISEQAMTSLRVFIGEVYGEKFVPAKPREFAVKGKVQNAHEAIRPTSVYRTPSQMKPYLKPAQYKLYKLIWERFVASQMSAAVLDATTVDIKAADCLFRSSGSVVRFPGFMQVYMEGKDENETSETDAEATGNLPAVKANQELSLKELLSNQHFTQPPFRYTEAMLVKVMEELGIGRPSTYAPIIDTIITRGYVVREDKHFYSTELGSVVVDLLKENFPNIIDTEFTAKMEDELDVVEEGNLEWREVVRQFYGPFSEALKQAEEKVEKVELAPEYTGELCEKCGKPMVYKMGRFGKFMACSGFPECHNTKAIVNDIGVKCLACGGNIIQRKSKSRRIFYGCDNYPNCKYISWDKPIEEKCPSCGWQLTEKETKQAGKITICPNPDCPSKPAVPVKRGRKAKK